MSKRGTEEVIPFRVNYVNEIHKIIDNKEELDNYIYSALNIYLNNSWLKNYIIPIKERVEYYKFFYCNLIRKEVKELILIFLQQYRQLLSEYNYLTIFNDIFINNILIEYMRNNVYIGNYITYTNNLTVFKPNEIILVIKNNNHTYTNRRMLFMYNIIHNPNYGNVKYKETLIEHFADIVSIVSNDSTALFLDTSNKLYKFSVIMNQFNYKEMLYYNNDENGPLDKTSLDKINIVSIHIGNKYRYFINDEGKVFRNGIFDDNDSPFMKVKFRDENHKLIEHPKITLLSVSLSFTVVVDDNNNIYISQDSIYDDNGNTIESYFDIIKKVNDFFLELIPLEYSNSGTKQKNKIIYLSSSRSKILINIYQVGFYEIILPPQIMNMGGDIVSIKPFTKNILNESVYNTGILSFDSTCVSENNIMFPTGEKSILQVDGSKMTKLWISDSGVLRTYGFNNNLYIMSGIHLSPQKIHVINIQTYNKREIEIDKPDKKWTFECFICKRGTLLIDNKVHKFLCSSDCQYKYSLLL
jgi:hypothetical protein